MRTDVNVNKRRAWHICPLGVCRFSEEAKVKYDPTLND